MRIVEILDSLGIDSSNIESWIEECANFRSWYYKSGTHIVDDLEMEKAYLKIIPLNRKFTYDKD